MKIKCGNLKLSFSKLVLLFVILHIYLLSGQTVHPQRFQNLLSEKMMTMIVVIIRMVLMNFNLCLFPGSGCLGHGGNIVLLRLWRGKTNVTHEHTKRCH